MCGDDATTIVVANVDGGPVPRVRGPRGHGAYLAERVRTSPARAGDDANVPSSRHTPADQPRWCGDDTLTWMIADGVPEIAQSERLGHKIIQDSVRETYSHVAQEVENRLLVRLQERWDDAVAQIGEIPRWRDIGAAA